MSLSISIDTSWRNEMKMTLFVFALMKNENKENKLYKIILILRIHFGNEILLFVPLITDYRKWRDELMYFFFYWIIVYWICRDWRGSNPQLPPWQGGALTNWTTIPGKRNTAYIFFWFHSNTFCLDFKLESPRCNRVRVVGNIDIHTHIYFSDTGTNY